MYFHDLTFKKELKKALEKNLMNVRWIQAEHKLGRIRIALESSFTEIDNLISFMTMYMHDRNSEWRFKSKEFCEKSVFVDAYILVEFKEMITL